MHPFLDQRLVLEECARGLQLGATCLTGVENQSHSAAAMRDKPSFAYLASLLQSQCNNFKLIAFRIIDRQARPVDFEQSAQDLGNRLE